MPKQTGPVSQRDLVPLLKELCDAAMAGNSSAHKDIAKRKLRQVLDETNWRTTYVLNNISTKRAKHIAGMGYFVPSKWLLTSWRTNRPGVDKPDVID